MSKKLILAFDTSNEFVSIGVGYLDETSASIDIIATAEIASNRSSNKLLLPSIDEIFKTHKLNSTDIDLVAVGLGPGSFTGVRIAIACAKGLSVSLNVPVIGLSTLDCVAQNVVDSGFMGKLCVAMDAMRAQVYPAFYEIDSFGFTRLTSDKVISATSFFEELGSQPIDVIAGDGLYKHAEIVDSPISVLPRTTWNPTGKSLLELTRIKYLEEEDSLFCLNKHNAHSVLPIYTRLSDAEEAEREKLKESGSKNLITGVQGDYGILPCCVSDAHEIATIERRCFSHDTWSESSIINDIKRENRIWYKAQDRSSNIIGYCAFMLSNDRAELLKLAIDDAHRKKGIATALLLNAFYDIRNLKKDMIFLEVSAGNISAINLYKSIGFTQVSIRKNYYGQGRDAIVMHADVCKCIAECENRAKTDCDLEKSLTTNSSNPFDQDAKLILNFESSCDETAASIVDLNGEILSNVISSSASFHARFGGVVPEIASRKHLEVISLVAESALIDAHLKSFSEVDAIAVTNRPGLVGSLVVGVSFAKAIAWATGLPLIEVDHLKGHFYANTKADAEIEFPAVASLISGGNTMLVGANSMSDFEVLGGSIDDAVGEAFDKLARALNLPYPGGPVISRLAEEGLAENVDLPRPMLHSHDLRMSLSGLKTACMLKIEEMKAENVKLRDRDDLSRQQICDLCAAFEESICDVQVSKAKDAILSFGAKVFCFGGGVAANKQLRHRYKKMCDELHIPLVLSPIELCGDNAAMIGLVAIDSYKSSKFADLDLDVYVKSEIFAK